MNNIFNNNPELERNLLIELTPARKAAMPLLLIALFLLIAMVSMNNNNVHTILQTSYIVVYSLLVNVWGAKLASDSIIGEQNERTWDNQRMTLLTPSQMLFGKLFGSTIFAWYGGLVCIIFYIISLFDSTSVFSETMTLLSMIASSIFVHAVVIILSLFAVDKFRHKNKINSILYVLIGLSIGYQINTGISLPSFFEMAQSRASGQALLSTSTWYGLEVNRFFINFLYMLFIATWAVIGAYYSIKKEMQYKTDSRMYFLFFVSTFIFTTGFFVTRNDPGFTHFSALTFAMIISLIMCVSFFYLLALNEPKNFIELKTFYEKIQNRDYKNIYNFLPTWLITLICIAIVCIVVQLFILLSLDSIYDIANNAKLSNNFNLNIFFPITLLVAICRDMCIILYINSISKYKKPDTTSFIFLVAIYLLFSIFFLGVLQSPNSISIIIPTIFGNVFTCLIIPIIELIIVAFLLQNRVKEIYLNDNY